jgi:hypothetical protein
MESRFAHDFSQVRVHTDERATASADAIAANAYTLGNHIVFGQRPSARLLAHELAHVVQQSGAPAASPMTAAIGGADTPLEREADRATDLVGAGEIVAIGGRGGAIQRDASSCSYGEIRSWAITSLKDFTAPGGLGDAKASIGAACAKNPCNCVDGSKATEAGDKAAWTNIVAASGTDKSGGGELMCVGSEGCYFVHKCTTCSEGKAKVVARATNLASTGTASVSGHGTLYFYHDPLKGWCNAEEFKSGCKAKPKKSKEEKAPQKGKGKAEATPEKTSQGEERNGGIVPPSFTADEGEEALA